MAEKENDENAANKEQKEEENERIKTENQEKSAENHEQGDSTKNQNGEKPGLEVIKETDTVVENPDNKPEEKNRSNNSEKEAENAGEPERNGEKESDQKDATIDKKDNQEIPVEKPKPATIDLKAVQTHYRTHTKTTLPHLLTEYGFEDKTQPKKVVKNDREKTKKKKKKKVEIVETSDDEDRRDRKVIEKKFNQMFGDNRNIETYYAEYLEFLHEKVMKQRLQAQKRKEEEERLAALREEEERKTRHTFTRRLAKIELTHNDSFLKGLPKTDLARIVKLQEKMKKEGKLKTQADVDKFWSDIRDPDIFYAQFKVKRTFDPGPSPLRKPLSPQPDLPPRSLSHISESSKGEKEPWAITQKYQSVHGHKTPTGEKLRKDSAQLAREAAADLEKRCPKLEMPPLACFSLKLREKPPDPAEVQKKVELKAREKSRKKFQRKLQRMYQMAMTNSAASNRILAQHGDLTSIMDGGTLRDVLAVFEEPYTLEQHYRDLTDPTRQLDQLPDHISEASHISQGSRRSSASSGSRLTPISQTGSRPRSLTKRVKKSPEMLEAPPAPVPLSFDEVFTREKTIEAKCLSTYWSNYMNAGKSVFAPT